MCYNVVGDDTHHKKPISARRGMTPINENMIRVIDENANQLSPTYKRRAKGLVKAGRAYWTSVKQDELCLYSRPENISEEKMNEDNKATELTIEDYNELHKNRITPADILDRMDRIRSDSGHIFAAIELLKDFEINDSVNGGIGDAERAKAIAAIANQREATLQIEMRMLERMYDDLMKDKLGSSDQ